MTTRHIQLVDQFRTILAQAQVVDEGGCFGGTVELGMTPAPIRSLFEEFEEIVNGQMFAFLDEIQEKISSIPIRAIFDDGSDVPIEDLQIYPSTGDLSFRLTDASARKPETARPRSEFEI